MGMGDEADSYAGADSKLADDGMVEERDLGFEFEEDDDDGSDVPNTAFSPINFNVTTRRISDIFASYNDQELDTTPAFQRGYVWDRGRASRLIESVLLHVPLPLVYTAEEESGREVVIDGQQRLMTFIGFLANKFPSDGRPFKLSKLKILKHLQGKSYGELDGDLKTAFRRFGVTVIRISNSTQQDVKFEIFERLNTGSVSLSAQELRNCIYRGSLNDLIKSLANEPAFLRVLALKDPPKRMIHAEMVLRFLAFSHMTHLNYPGKMKNFMNKFMEDHQHINADRSAEWKQKFLLACDNSFSVFGDKAFRRYRLGSARNHDGGWESPINKALFDCVMFAFCRLEKRQIMAYKDEIRERVIDLMVNDQDFSDAIILGTSDPARVRTRFDKLQTTLANVIEVPAGERRRFSLAEKQRLFDQNPTCGFCSQRIESIDDAEVDHHVRFSDGGPTSIENARIAHRYCNRADRQMPGDRRLGRG